MHVHMYKHRHIHTYIFVCVCMQVHMCVFLMFSEILFPVGRCKDMDNPPMDKSVRYSLLLKPNFPGDI